MLATLMHDYPDTLVMAAGDGEIELTDTRLDESTPYESQIIADYSPFTILEFRDWVRHTGMYGPGAQYDGQGRAASGTRYQDDVTGLANFNADFGTSFATWDLCYFNWALTDSVDGDPKAIPDEPVHATHLVTAAGGRPGLHCERLRRAPCLEPAHRPVLAALAGVPRGR